LRVRLERLKISLPKGALVAESKLKSLRKIRDQLRSRRLGLILALGEKLTDQNVELVADIQRALEAVDAAISEEEKQPSKATKTRRRTVNRRQDHPHTSDLKETAAALDEADTVFDPFDDVLGG
jgi:hypothetical protein